MSRSPNRATPCGSKPRKGLPKRVALAQHGDPGEPGLKAVEHEHLPQCPRVALGDAPFLVMVGLHQRILAGPGATGAYC